MPRKQKPQCGSWQAPVGKVREPVGRVEPGIPALERDRHTSCLGAVLLASPVHVDGQLGVRAGERSHGFLLGWRPTDSVDPPKLGPELGFKVKGLTLNRSARSTVAGCAYRSSPDLREYPFRRCAFMSGPG